MKQRMYFILLICLSAFSTAYADLGPIDPPAFPNGQITMEQALERVKQDFMGQDVDYYGNFNLEMDTYTIYADLAPLKCWPHEGKVYGIRKTQFGNAVVIDGVGNQNFPSSSFLSPYGALEYKNRYGDYATVKPFVKKVNYPAGIPDASKRTYAIILQGYDSHITNTEVSWNDCSFIYQVLTKKFGVPKEQIFPMMAKGDIEDCWIKKAAGGFGIHSRDLDGDGIEDVTMGAYLQKLKDLFKTLDSKLKEDDHLFVFWMVRVSETERLGRPISH